MGLRSYKPNQRFEKTKKMGLLGFEPRRSGLLKTCGKILVPQAVI
jgi:hypothetical protein